MKLPIYLYGTSVLREVATDVPADYPDLQKLISNMFDTMYAAEGCGLAAPQIGRSIRLVVIDADVLGDTFPECAGRKFALINPTVEVLDGESVARNEGCLSLPGLSESVSRVEHIRLTWTDENWQEHTEEMSGFLARIVQHECDHLYGKVYMDHVSSTRRMLLRSKLRNLAEGRVACDYPVRSANKHR